MHGGPAAQERKHATTAISDLGILDCKVPPTILDLIFDAVTQSPNAIAMLWLRRIGGDCIGCEDIRAEKWSYRDVWNASALAADRLSELISPAVGGPTPLIGLAVVEGPFLPIIQLAVLLARCGVVPLDPAEPPARFKFILEDASLAAIVAKDVGTALRIGEPCAGGVAKLGIGDLLPDSLAALTELAGVRLRQQKQSYPRDCVSHVFFTSGSTGRPKGCVCTLGNLSAYCVAKNIVFDSGRKSVVFVASAHTFDPSLGDFFATWASGGCIAIAPRNVTTTALKNCLRGSAATHVLATPALFSTLEETRPSDLPSLAVVGLGGEPTPAWIVNAWSGESGVRLINVYGLTECTVYQASANMSTSTPSKCLGLAFPCGTRLAVAAGDGDDPTDSVVASSRKRGELWIFGPQVGQGYCRRPELTSERFRDVPGFGRGFRTGDIVAAQEYGWEFIGRRDSMVKIQGKRVELGEIEEVLLSAASDLLSACAVVLCGGAYLAAWVVPHGGGDAGSQSPHSICDGESGSCLRSLLRSTCEEHLPNHMVPAAFALVESLPQTATGKVSRRELAAWSVQNFCTDEEPATPVVDDLETLVASVWSEVLGVVVSHREAHFMTIGGESLTALRVCKLLAAKLSGVQTTGEFGETLPQAFLPGELLKRPRLLDYVQHLNKAGVTNTIGFSTCAQTGDELLPGCDHQKWDALLQRAASVGSVPIVRHLINLKSSSASARMAMHAACFGGHLAVVEFLLDARGSPSATNGDGVAPLHLAAASGCASLVHSLLAAKARPSLADKNGQTPLHCAARYGAPARVLEALSERGMEPVLAAGKGLRGRCAGKRASRGVHRRCGEAEPIDVKDQWSRTPLHWAVVNGHRSVVAWLLEHGADKLSRDSQGESPLQLAERRAQCRAQDRPEGLGASVFGDIATLLGGHAQTARAT